MRKRWSRKLAGCIVSELALAATGFAADYRAGASESGSVRALVLEDARGNRAVFTQTEFRITQAVADFVAARLLRSLDLGRPGLLFHWSGIGARPEQPEDLVTAITAAVNALEPAEIRYGHRSLSVAAGVRCLGNLSPDGALASAGCTDGAAVTSGIRAAFQMVEPAHGLQKRGEPSGPATSSRAVDTGRSSGRGEPARQQGRCPGRSPKQRWQPSLAYLRRSRRPCRQWSSSPHPHRSS